MSTRSELLLKKILIAEQNHTGPSLPVIDMSDYTSQQINALLVYLYTSRVLSDNLNGAELQQILHESRARVPSGSIVSLPSILSADMSQLLERKIVKNREAIDGDSSSSIITNEMPVAGRWSDIKLLLDDKEIAAHKAILCANSEYFRQENLSA